MHKLWDRFGWIAATIVGSAIFALGFSLFLAPNDMSPGGISGLAMILVEVLHFGSVGKLSILINLPLFILGGLKIFTAVWSAVWAWAWCLYAEPPPAALTFWCGC